MKETGNINRSLFTLGKVIATLDKYGGLSLNAAVCKMPGLKGGGSC